MAGQDIGTSSSLMVRKGWGYSSRAAVWTTGPLGRALEQLFGWDPPSASYAVKKWLPSKEKGRKGLRQEIERGKVPDSLLTAFPRSLSAGCRELWIGFGNLCAFTIEPWANQLGRGPLVPPLQWVPPLQG